MEVDPLHGMTPDCPAAFLSSLESLEQQQAAGSVELPQEALKDLLPLGHEICLWATAAKNLTTRVSKDRLPNNLTAFLKNWLPETPIDRPATAIHLLLSQSPKGWQISDSSLPWMRAPTWSALLQLPCLRSMWMNELRASHHDHLLHLLPSAWLLDPTPLPPGTVVSRLEISEWADLIRFHKLGRAFKIHSGQATTNLTQKQTGQEWLTSITQGIQSARSVLVEQRDPHAWLLARYEINDRRVSLTKAWLSEKNTIHTVIIN